MTSLYAATVSQQRPAPVRILDDYEPDQPPDTFEAALEAARSRMGAERSG